MLSEILSSLLTRNLSFHLPDLEAVGLSPAVLEKETKLPADLCVVLHLSTHPS